MDKLIASLEKLDNWEYKLYLLVKNEFERFVTVYQIAEEEFNKRMKNIFLNSHEIISGNKGKYLVRSNIANLNSKHPNIDWMLQEPIYDLNQEEIQLLLYANFFSPLNKEMELREELIKSKKLKTELQKKYAGIKMSDPQEQKLFELVWELEEGQRKKLYSPDFYKNFIEINEKHQLINSSLIIYEKFTSSNLFNRYKAFRDQQPSYQQFKRKNKKNIR